MKLVRCSNGHFYDEEKYGNCPHCGNSIPAKKDATHPVVEVPTAKNEEPQPKKEEGSGKSLFGWRKSKKDIEEKNEVNTISKTQSMENDVDDEDEKTAYIPMETSTTDRHMTVEQTMQPVSVSVMPSDKGEPKLDTMPTSAPYIPIAMPTPVSTMNQAPTPIQSVSSMPSPTQSSLRSAVEEAQADMDDIKTVGYFGNATGTEPVVGWLVAIEGPAKGISYELIAGKNSIGRSSTMTVVIVQDNKVSRDKHTTVMYEPGGRKFYLLAGESNGMVYYNGDILLENKVLAKGDRIKVGDSVLLFVPLCGEDFSWEE